MEANDVSVIDLGKEAIQVPDTSTVFDKNSVPIPQLSWKEIKSLQKCKYDENIMLNPKFKKIYTIKNKKTGMIVALRAASSYHACNIIGWKANQVIVLYEEDSDLSLKEEKDEDVKQV